MSYINTNLLKSKGLTLLDLQVLQLAKQARIEDISDVLSEYSLNVDTLLGLGYLESIKGKKGDSEFQKIRATKLGNALLEDLETPDINSDDLKLFDWLEGVYKSMGKEAGNKRKCKNFIAQFRVNSGICRNHLAFLCQTFINDEKEIEFSQKLEFLFFKGANLFSTKFDIYQSRLFQYYEKRKDYFEEEFSKINN